MAVIISSPESGERFPYEPTRLEGEGSQTVVIDGSLVTLPPLAGGSWHSSVLASGSASSLSRLGDYDQFFQNGEHGLLAGHLNAGCGARIIGALPDQLERWLERAGVVLPDQLAKYAFEVWRDLSNKRVLTWSRPVVTKQADGTYLMAIPFTQGTPVLAIIAIAIAAIILLPLLVVSWKLMKLSPGESIEAGREVIADVLKPFTDVSEGLRDVGSGLGEGLKFTGIGLGVVAAIVAIVFLVGLMARSRA
jgi:hypothetical protein